jgi:hypothetical protein
MAAPKSCASTVSTVAALPPAAKLGKLNNGNGPFQIDVSDPLWRR